MAPTSRASHRETKKATALPERSWYAPVFVDVHLVDGTYELFRAFYGAPEARAPDGREVGATRALARSLLSLVEKGGASHVAVAFDHVIESFRNNLFDGYKTGDGIEPRLRAQFDLAEEMLRAVGFVVWPMVEFEADDALATAASRFSTDERVERVHICSPDKDLTQCVSGTRIVAVDRRRKRTLDEDGVEEKFGVRPRSIPDWLALVGDSADGIPGIPRWGQRSASTVLAVYERLEDIPAEPQQWSVQVRGALGLAESLNRQRESAYLFRTLATLRRDVPLEESLDDLAYRGPDFPALRRVTTAIGDEALYERLSR